MTVDFSFVFYVENVILTAGVILAMIHRDGGTLWAWPGEEEAGAPPPLLIVTLGAAFWPIAWAVAAIGGVASLIKKLAAKQAA